MRLFHPDHGRRVTEAAMTVGGAEMRADLLTPALRRHSGERWSNSDPSKPKSLAQNLAPRPASESSNYSHSVGMS